MKFHSTILTVLVAVAVLAFASSAMAITCVTGDFACTATTNVVQYNGTPTVPCPNWSVVVQVTINTECLGGTGVAGPIVGLRCGITTDGFEFSGGGYDHKVFLRHGDWEGVLNGGCQYVGYKANIQ